MSNHTGGPTLNVSYNNLLKDWAAQGCASDPQCEECGKDTTDKQMHDIGIMWVCKDCNIMITQGEPADETFDEAYEREDYMLGIDSDFGYDYEFADPGGRSSLRAESESNPRNLPCGNCGEPDRLTPKDVALHYQCDQCADRAEGRSGY